MNATSPDLPGLVGSVRFLLLACAFAFGGAAPLRAGVPDAGDDAATLNEDGVATVFVLVNDSDPDGDLDTASLALAVPAARGTAALVDASLGLFSYVPDPNVNGADSFAYRLCDTLGACDTAWVRLTVNPVNDAPVVLRDTFSVLQGNTDTLAVLANDNDPLDPLGGINPASLAFVSFPSSGSISLIGGAFSYTSVPGFTGLDSFRYRVADAGNPPPGIFDTAWVLIEVLPAAPVALPDTFALTEDVPATLAVLANDTDPQGDLDSASLAVITPPAKGTATVSGTALAWTPDPDANGPDSLRYRVCDATPLCDSAWVRLDLAPVNDAPVAADDAAAVGGGLSVLVDVLANDADPADPDGGVDAASLSLAVAPSAGTATVEAGAFRYAAGPLTAGVDSFAYRVGDLGTPLPARFDTAWVVLTRFAAAPVALDDAVTLDEDDPPTPLGVGANDSDPQVNLHPDSLFVLEAPLLGTATVDTMAGDLVYTPDPDAFGADSLVYRTCDSTGLCDTARVFVTLLPVNDPPVALDDAGTVAGGLSIDLPVLANDSDPDGTLDTLTLALVSLPLHGTALVETAEGVIGYTADAGYAGADSLAYRIGDDGTPVAFDTAWVRLTVFAAAPSAEGDTLALAEDGSGVLDLAANDTDPQGDLDPATAALLGAPLHGAAVLAAGTAQLTYTPDADYNGADSVAYRICDATGLCDSATVYLEIAPVNDPPTALDDTASTAEDVPVTVAVLANDDDAADPLGGLDPDSLTIVLAPAFGTALVLPGGSIQYTPDPDFAGADLLRYRVCDLGNPLPAACAEAELALTVLPVNDPPLVLADTADATEDSPVLINVLLNDADPEDGPLSGATVAVTDPAAAGSTTVSPLTGQVTYTPDPDANGADSFRYRACDADGACDSAWVLVRVAPVNDAPVLVADSAVTAEDTPVTVVVLANDDDARDAGALDPASVAITVPPASGLALVNPDGSITYTPAADDTTQASFTYSACDTGTPLPALCGAATVFIDLLPVNDPPVVVADADTTLEDFPVVTNVLGNDSDIEDGALPAAGVSVVTPPANGAATVLPLTGQVSYTPDPDFNGTDRYVYEACDADGACDTAGVDLLVLPVNDPPDAQPEGALTAEDTPVAIDVLANDNDDRDPAGGIDPTSVGIVLGPFHGAAVPDALSGVVTYSPDADYNGLDSFRYRVCDLGAPLPALCDEAWVGVSVSGTNDPPVLLDDAATVPEDGSVVVPVLVNDTDVEDGTPLPGTVNVLSGPSNGGTVVNPLTGAVTYTPDADYHGPDAFTYEACDAAGACGSASVTLTVTPVNDAPVAANDDRLGTEDGVLVINILANDGDPRDPTGGLDPGSVLALSGPFHGSVAFSPVTGAATYTPDPDYNGIDSFRYRVCDLGTPLPALCAQAVVNLALAPVNDAPLVQDDADATPEDTPVATDVAGNDSDPRDPLGGIDAASISILTPPANGMAVPGPGAGLVTYTPDPGFLGTDSYVYRICDDGNPLPALCGTATVTITVSDEAPTAVNDAATTVEEVAVAIDVVANDTDPQPNLDTASVTVVTPPVKGVTAVDPLTGVITYTPDPDANGADAFGYRICDLDGFCDQATVSVSIAPVNDPPLVQLDTETTPEDVAVSTPVTANDSDPRDPAGNIDPATVSVTVPPANGTTVVNPVTGAVTYTPDPDFFGVDVYTYQVCDDGNPLPAACGTANVIVTVTPVNDPPSVVDDAAVTAEDTPAGIPVTDNDSDVEDGGVLPGTVTVLDAPDHGSAVVSPVTGVITYTPALNYNGPDSLRYRACDADGACDDALVLLTVTPVNDPPVTAPDAATTPEDVPVTVPVLANDNDAADPTGGLDPSSVSILVAPALGLAVPDPLTGAITYTPDPDANGTDALTYRVCDLGTPLPPACQTAVLSLTVTPVNDPPSVLDDVASTAEDSPVLIPVLANDDDDRDPGGGMDPGSVVVLVAPLNGSTSVSSGGVVTYTPDPGFAGVDSFRYEACDAGAPLPALCGNALVVVTVSNESPVAVDDVATLAEDGSSAVDVLANDTDPQNNIDPATVSIVTVPTFGTAVPDPVTGVVTYTPAADYNGTDFFEYRVCDLTGYCDQARVDLTIAPVNDPPVALNDAETTPEDVSVTTAVLFNDNDAADPLGGLDPASVVVIVPPANGTTAVLPLSGEIVYTPDPDVNGSDTYTYRVCDLGHPLPAACDQAVVVVTVNPVDDPIVAVDDAATVGIGTALTVPVVDNDLDPDGDLDPASVTVTEAPANGTAVADGSGGVTYTPALAFFGLDTFIYRVCDANGNCDEARVVLTVTASPPVAVNDTFAVLPNRTSALDVLANDVPGTSALVPSSVSVTLLPTFGTAVPDPLDGAILYTPDPDACGTDSLAYVVCDGDGLCASARVRVEVACIDLVAVDDSASTAFGEAVTLAVLANDGGNADPDCLQVTEPPANGSADVQPDGTVLYTPDPGFSGTDCFRYAVCDTTESVVASAVACVTVQPELVLQVPVAFSPNGDGYNDRLFIPGLDDWPRHDLVVFNRWESRVFGAAPYGGDWDGRWEGNGEPLPDGTYFYILRLDPSDPDAPVLSGSINIVR